MLTWEDWITHHTTLFGITAEDHMAMVSLWVKLFHNAGFTPAELMVATDHVAQHEDPKFPSDHRALLFSRLRAGRMAKKPTGYVDPEMGNKGCVGCQWSGYIEVPSLDWHYGTSGGRWYSQLVHCRCTHGEYLHGEWVRYVEQLHIDKPERYTEAHVRGAEQRTIDFYERFNGNWQAQMAQYRQALRDELSARNAETQAASLGKLTANKRGMRLLKHGVEAAIAKHSREKETAE